MEYQTFVDEVKKLDFIEKEETADAAVKAVFGMLVSRMENEDDAREFTNTLPEPLTYEKLRSHQVRPTYINPEQYLEVLTEQFKLSMEDAEKLVKTVLRTTRENLSEAEIGSLKDKLPEEWNTLVEV